MHTHVCVQRFKCLVHGVFSTTCDVRCFIISKCFCIVIHVEKLSPERLDRILDICLLWHFINDEPVKKYTVRK